MNIPEVLPVIHVRDGSSLAAEQAELASNCGADGIFLISHHGDDNLVIKIANELRRTGYNLPIGINLLNTNPLDAVRIALDNDLDMVWADYMGVNSVGVDPLGHLISQLSSSYPFLKLFASIAFKYQRLDPDPSLAAFNALRAGFIPTTSGVGTGKAPEVSKITEMSEASSGNLAIASGMTPENVALFAPHLSHILVATGVSLDDYHFDKDKLTKFMNIVKT